MDDTNDLMKNIDSLPLAIRKFMKLEYIVSYEESKNNEKEIEEMKNKNNQLDNSSKNGNKILL